MMTHDEITTTLRAFARSRKSGCRACPEYNSCGKIGCRMADEAARALMATIRPVGCAETGKWISTADWMPAPEKEVLACCRTRGGTIYWCVAIYIAPGTTREESVINWDYEACEYDEEKDEYFVVPGWYEQIKNWGEYGFVHIADDVTHWMELPEVPNEQG